MGIYVLIVYYFKRNPKRKMTTTITMINVTFIFLYTYELKEQDFLKANKNFFRAQFRHEIRKNELENVLFFFICKEWCLGYIQMF